MQEEEEQVQREHVVESESHGMIGMQSSEHKTICFGVEAIEHDVRIVGEIGKLLIICYSVNSMKQYPASFRIKCTWAKEQFNKYQKIKNTK